MLGVTLEYGRGPMVDGFPHTLVGIQNRVAEVKQQSVYRQFPSFCTPAGVYPSAWGEMGHPTNSSRQFVKLGRSLST